MKENLIIRNAVPDDAEFLTEVIVNAEKGSGNILSYSALFDITEPEFCTFLKQVFAEDITGFEFSVRNFLIAEHNYHPVAAYAGWVEAHQGVSSALLKMIAFKTFLPKKHIIHYETISHIAEKIRIKRDPGFLQLEMAYVREAYRGFGILGSLTEAHINKAKMEQPTVSRAQVQVFKNNQAGLRGQLKQGFTVVEEKSTDDSRILNYMPGNTRIKLEKVIG